MAREDPGRLVRFTKKYMSESNAVRMDEQRWADMLAKLYEEKRTTYRMIGTKAAARALARELSRRIEAEIQAKKPPRRPPPREPVRDVFRH